MPALYVMKSLVDHIPAVTYQRYLVNNAPNVTLWAGRLQLHRNTSPRTAQGNEGIHLLGRLESGEASIPGHKRLSLARMSIGEFAHLPVGNCFLIGDLLWSMSRIVMASDTSILQAVQLMQHTRYITVREIDNWAHGVVKKYRRSTSHLWTDSKEVWRGTCV